MDKRPIVVWLSAGLFLVYFQIIIGGVTRLTGSGLSITKWEIVTGTLPPFTDAAWESEFAAYKETPQYEKINKGMSLKEFKFIYFWEYLHRLWARMMGFIFLIPFIWFYLRGRLNDTLKKDLGVVVGLAALAASFGWIMVASGLVERPWVNAYKLSVHLCLGISVFTYLFWTLLKFRFPAYKQGIRTQNKRWMTMVLFGLLIAQLVFGGIMSGMKASLIYPTWPDIGGYFIPPDLMVLRNWTLDNFIHYDTTSFAYGLIHLLHRFVAYGIVLFGTWYYFNSNIRWEWDLKSKLFYLFLGFVAIQVFIGILILLKSVGYIPVTLGVLHQGMAVLVFTAFVGHMYFLRKPILIDSTS